MAKLRNYGPPIFLSAPLTLGVNAQVTGTGVGTYDNTFIPYPTIDAGYYSFGDFCILVSQKLRQWFFDVANDPGTPMVVIGTVDSILFTIDFVQGGNSFNSCRVNLTIVDLSVTVGGTHAAVTVLTLLAGWPHLLGLGQEGANVFGSIVGPFGAQALGVFCPRGINATLRSEIRDRLRKTKEIYNAQPLSDGTIDVYQIGNNKADDAWTIKDNKYEISGDPFRVGTLESISVSRLLLSVAYPKVTTRVTGITGAGLYTPYLPVGAYVGIDGAGAEGFVSRVKAITTPGTEGGANRIQIELWEKVPANFAVKLKSPLYRVPEAWAARFDALRLDSFLLYGSEDASGAPLWIFEDWALNGDGSKFEETVERRANTNNQYSITFAGLRRIVSKATLVAS